MDVTIDVTLWSAIHKHLNDPLERALFLFVRQTDPGGLTWEAADSWFLTSESDYQSVSGEHLALADHIPGEAIKRAHDSETALLEIHGHYGPGQHTRFSAYDIEGLSALVPHVLWRLPGRPYFALVVGRDSVDGLVWLHPRDVSTIGQLHIGHLSISMTGQSERLYSSFLE